MNFVRGLWKILVAVKDALVLLLLLMFFGTLYGVLTWTPHPGGPTRGALAIAIDGPVVEQPAQTGPLQSYGAAARPHEYRLAELVQALAIAARDPRIQAVSLDLDIFSGGRQTTLSDLGTAIDGVRRAGKRVVAYATAYDDDSYQIAAHADEIWLNPMGAVLITGPGASNLYYGQLLQRLGVTANVYRVGAYKSAVEPYTRSDMSPEARQAAQELANALWGQWQDEVRRVRPKAEVGPYVQSPTEAIARFGGDMAGAARGMGLVDRVGDRSAFERRMAELVGTIDRSRPESYRAVPYENFAMRYPLRVEGGGVGVLTVAGDIVDGEAGAGTAGSETIVRTLQDATRGRNIRALVVRIDSPGGSAMASERIRLAIAQIKARGIPVIVSMGSVAASGGYWIATVGDRIFAEPSTITGSIGVFGIVPSFQGTLRQAGIGADGVRTTPLSGEPDLLRGPSPEAGRFLQLGIDSTYRRFLALVSQARRLPVERVNEIAQGRVWDGGTARQIGLVDQFGSLDDAVREAARRAGIDPDDAPPLFIEPQSSWFTRWFGGQAQTADGGALRDPFARFARRPQALIRQALVDAQNLVTGSAIQVRCLECPASFDWAPSGAESGSWWQLLLGRALAH